MTSDERYNHVDRTWNNEDYFGTETNLGDIGFRRNAEQGSWGAHLSANFETENDDVMLGDINVDEALSLAKLLTEWAEAQR